MHPKPFNTGSADEKEDEPGEGFGCHAGGRSPPFPFSSQAHPHEPSYDSHYGSQHGPSQPQRSCPRCHSPQIESRHLARRIAAVLGVTAGATSGVVRAMKAAEVLSTGAKIGLAAGLRATSGPVAGTVASALAAALLEGAAGCAQGVRFGEAIDRMILPNYRCLACKHTFSTPTDSAP